MRRSILKQITYFVLSVNINHLDIIEKHFQKKLNNWGGGGVDERKLRRVFSKSNVYQNR